MKTLLKYIAHISVILNAYYHMTWIVVFNTYNTHPERVQAFRGLTLHMSGIALLLPTLLSIVFYLVYVNDHKWLYGILAGLQILLLALHIWYLL